MWWVGKRNQNARLSGRRLGGDPCGVDPRVDLGLDRLRSQGSTLDRSRVDSRGFILFKTLCIPWQGQIYPAGAPPQFCLRPRILTLSSLWRLGYPTALLEASKKI